MRRSAGTSLGGRLENAATGWADLGVAAGAAEPWLAGLAEGELRARAGGVEWADAL